MPREYKKDPVLVRLKISKTKYDEMKKDKERLDFLEYHALSAKEYDEILSQPTESSELSPHFVRDQIDRAIKKLAEQTAKEFKDGRYV